MRVLAGLSVFACVYVCMQYYEYVAVCVFVLRGWSLLIFEQTHTCKILVLAMEAVNVTATMWLENL